ncbi:MAG: hypothetical protein HY548_03660, partial [Elusimicrobia bacterium]|nr:hypothetical protein [Elusimicrobiota bacterium]
MTETGADGASVLNNTFETETSSVFGTDDRISFSVVTTYLGRLSDVAFIREHAIEAATKDMAYNDRGLLKSYTRTTTEDNKAVVEKASDADPNDDKDALQYNALGWLLKSRLEVTEKSVSDNGAALSKVQIIDTTNDTFDAAGRVLTYQRTVADAKTLTENTRNANVYNALGQLTFSDLAYTETATGLDRSFEVKSENMVYDAGGRPQRLTRTTTEDLDSSTQDKKEIVETVSGQTYENGRLAQSNSSVVERVVDSGGAVKAVTRSYAVNILSTRYNGLGQAVAQTRTRAEFGKDITEDMQLMEYDRAGLLVHSVARTEERTSDARPELGGMRLFSASNTDFRVNSFNVLGQATRTTTVISGATEAPDRVMTIVRDGMSYLSNGQAKGYQEVQRVNSAPDRETITTRESTSYDDAGQAKAWKQNESINFTGSDTLKVLPISADNLKAAVFRGVPLADWTLEGFFNLLTGSDLTDAEKTSLAGTTLYQHLETLLTRAVESALPADKRSWAPAAVQALMADLATGKESLTGLLATSLTLAEALTTLFKAGMEGYQIAGGANDENRVVSLTVNQVVDAQAGMEALTYRQVLTNILKPALQGRWEARLGRTLNATETTELDTLVQSLVAVAPDTTLSDLYNDDALGNGTFDRYIRENIFSVQKPQNLAAVYDKILGKSLSGYGYTGGAPLGQATLGAVLTKMLSGNFADPAKTADASALAQTFADRLHSFFTDYQTKTTITSNVTSATYDLGRLTSRSETRSWASRGGGNIPGLDTGWRDVTDAQMSTTYAYYGGTDRLKGQMVSAGKTAGADNTYYGQDAEGKLVVVDWMDALGIDLKSMEGDITYDYAGRQTRSVTLTVAPQSWDYQYYKGALRDKYKGDTVQTARMATVTETEQLNFDGQGRAGLVNARFWRSDANRTQGTSSEKPLTYEGKGLKDTSQSSSRTTLSVRHDDDGDDGRLEGSPLGGQVNANWSAWAAGWTGSVNGLFGSDAWDSHAAGNFAYNSTGSGDRSMISNSGGNPTYHKYDAYGNPDEKNTRDASKATTTNSTDLTGTDGDNLTKLGQVIDYYYTFNRIVSKVFIAVGTYLKSVWIGWVLIAAGVIGDAMWAHLQTALRTGSNRQGWKA